MAFFKVPMGYSEYMQQNALYDFVIIEADDLQDAEERASERLPAGLGEYDSSRDIEGIDPTPANCKWPVFTNAHFAWQLDDANEYQRGIEAEIQAHEDRRRAIMRAVEAAKVPVRKVRKAA